MFDRKGYLVISREAYDVDEDQMLEDALEAGLKICKLQTMLTKSTPNPKEFAQVRDALEEKGYKFVQNELTMVPQNLTPIPKDKVEQFQAMIDQLEDDDDVQEVYTAGDWPDD